MSPTYLRCFQFQEVLRLDEDDEDHTAHPQKLVNVLEKYRGIQAYIGSGDQVTSVMGNTGGRGCEVTDLMHMKIYHTGNRDKMWL